MKKIVHYLEPPVKYRTVKTSLRSALGDTVNLIVITKPMIRQVYRYNRSRPNN